MYTYQPVGVFYREKGFCECRVWAPGKDRVELMLHTSPQPVVVDMQKDERGYWSTSIDKTFPGMRYSFRLDNETVCPDPASLIQPEGVFGPSEIADRHFPWTDENWKGIELGNMIQYEVHTGTFTPQGNLYSIIDKLDYLKDLGINTIELMPVAQFSGSRSWGYDVVFPNAVQNCYGGIKALKALTDAAHAKGIAIVLDVVYNHIGPEGSILHHYAPYFTEKYKTPWGAAINFDDAWCYGVRQFYLQNALMWLDEFHIDGLRIDAVHAIFDTSARHLLEELKDRVSDLEQRTGKKKVLIAEFDLNNPRYINPVEKGGYGLDGQWVDEFHHALHSLVTGETNGYYEDFGGLVQLHKAFCDTYVYTGQYSVQRKKDFGVPVSNPYSHFVVFAQNHDHIGNRMMGERLASQLSFEMLKLVAATVLLSPYTPLLFMGEEYGEKNPFLFFAGYSDEELVEKVRHGRKKEFGYFGWEGNPPDPFAEETFTGSKLSWNYHNGEGSVLLNYYRNLLLLRKNSTALREKKRHSMIVHPLNETKMLSFERISADEHLLIVLNFSDREEQFTSPPANWEKTMDSSCSQWNGPGEITGAVNPFSAVVLKQK